MILYKYLKHDIAMRVFENNAIAFSLANEFNDPFETLTGYPVKLSNKIESIFDYTRSNSKRDIWIRNSGILCLTRTPINPLMWAHYADEHKGIVIGIDVDIAGFCDEDKCIIPAQYGSIIYTNTRPNFPLKYKERKEPITIGHTHHFPAEHYDKLSLLFLQKAMYWSYEEEVRIVKCIADRDEEGVNISGKFKMINIDKRRLYLFKLPENSIKEIYIGLKIKFYRLKKN